mgnify:CR=1 FL=1
MEDNDKILTKKCSKCLIEKEIDEFFKHLGCKGGKRHDCKSCCYKMVSKEMKRKYSKVAIKRIDEGTLGPHAPYKTEWKFNPFTKQKEYMHSSWETKFLDKCIHENKFVTKRHNVRIQYRDDSIIREYIPDFYAPNDKTIIEIKAYIDENVEMKINALSEWCKNNNHSFEILKYNEKNKQFVDFELELQNQ